MKSSLFERSGKSFKSLIQINIRSKFFVVLAFEQNKIRFLFNMESYWNVFNRKTKTSSHNKKDKNSRLLI